MGQYSKKGLYSGYDKNHKEREALDYYATPPEEVTNILQELNLPKNRCFNILEPSCGGGHMVEGILNYFDNVNIYATDIKQRENKYIDSHMEKSVTYQYGKDYDFLSENYPYDVADIVIMNPPFKTIEPFLIRSLEIAEKGVIMFARLQFLEGQHRYDSILKENPFTDMYVYVDRIQCWKDGVKPEGSSAQAYAWFIWDKEKENDEPVIHWIRRAE